MDITDKDWARICSLVLRSNIRTKEAYVETSKMGGVHAREELRKRLSAIGRENVILSPTEIQAVAFRFFEKLYPHWQGDLRRPGLAPFESGNVAMGITTNKINQHIPDWKVLPEKMHRDSLAAKALGILVPPIEVTIRSHKKFLRYHTVAAEFVLR